MLRKLINFFKTKDEEPSELKKRITKENLTISYSELINDLKNNTIHQQTLYLDRNVDLVKEVFNDNGLYVEEDDENEVVITIYNHAQSDLYFNPEKRIPDKKHSKKYIDNYNTWCKFQSKFYHHFNNSNDLNIILRLTGYNESTINYIKERLIEKNYNVTVREIIFDTVYEMTILE